MRFVSPPSSYSMRTKFMNFFPKFAITICILSLPIHFTGFDLIKTEGILVFGRPLNFYFIETNEKNLESSLMSMDTLKIIDLASPDEGNDITGYKKYLTEKIEFKTTSFLRQHEDNEGKQVDYKDTADYKAGLIFYYNDNNIKPFKKRYHRITYKNKVVIFEIKSYVQLDHFQAF